MNIDKAMTLLYVGDETSFDFKQYLEGNILPSDYYVIRQIPLAEISSAVPTETAEDIIDMTTAVGWRGQGRRPVMCGDIFCNGYAPWMFLRTKDLDLLDDPTERFNGLLRLMRWPDYVIVNVSLDAVKDILCQT